MLVGMCGSAYMYKIYVFLVNVEGYECMYMRVCECVNMCGSACMYMVLIYICICVCICLLVCMGVYICM